MTAAAVLATAVGCGSSDDSSALRDELQTAQADVQTAEAERDRLAGQVEDLQRQLDALTDTTGSDSTVPASTAPATTAPTTTTQPAIAAPAALDASRYVTAFGDISAVSFPDGDPGVLAIAATGVLSANGVLPIIVRNNTANAIGHIEASGLARDAAGTLAGSGSSQGFQPVLVEPGEIAWGYVYFGGDMTGDGLTFELSVNGDEPDTYFLPVEITELNVTGEQIIGVVTNNLDMDVSGPIGIDGICFNTDGTLLGVISAFAEQEDLAPGGIGSFALDLYGDPCPSGLLGASGH